MRTLELMSLEVLSLSGDPRLFTLDLEWLGDIAAVRTVRIFSIALVHVATGQEFSAVVDPGVPHAQLSTYPAFPGCRVVTRSFLRRNNAASFRVAFDRTVEFAAEHAQGKTPIVIAHGAFRGDMPALESSLRKTSTAFPPWRWLDSLYFFRRVLPESDGYRLCDVAQSVGITPGSAGRAHDALPDARLLYACLKRGGWSHIYGAVYSWGQTPLLNVPGVGIKGQNLLFFHNIRSVEDLLNFSLSCRITPPATVGAAHTPDDLHRAHIEYCLASIGLEQEPSKQVASFCMGCVKCFEEN